jgi:hypothetical protein
MLHTPVHVCTHVCSPHAKGWVPAPPARLPAWPPVFAPVVGKYTLGRLRAQLLQVAAAEAGRAARHPVQRPAVGAAAGRQKARVHAVGHLLGVAPQVAAQDGAPLRVVGQADLARGGEGRGDRAGGRAVGARGASFECACKRRRGFK